MPEHDRQNTPIFFDERNRRWPWVLRFGVLGAAFATFGLVCFAISILALPLLPHNVLPRARSARDVGNNLDPIATDRRRARRQFAQKRDKRMLEAIRIEERQAHLPKPLAPLKPTANRQPVVAGFYVNWEETSLASLHRNIGELTHFFPEWLSLTSNGKGFLDRRNAQDRNEAEPFVRTHGLPIVPLLNNFIRRPGEENGDWSWEAVHALISNPTTRAGFILKLKQTVLANRWQGINIDFEIVRPEDRANLTAFMQELYAVFHPAGLLVTQDMQLDDAAFDVGALGKVNDYIIPMFYDEHSPNEDPGAGSVAGIPWTRNRVGQVCRLVDPSKVVMGLGSYAYDWRKGELAAATMSYQSAVIQAKESADPHDPTVAQIKTDPASLNPTYHYIDDDGKEHNVWMLDATTAFNQWTVAAPFHPAGYALWYLGAEDPGIWTLMGKTRIANNPGKRIDEGALDTITYGRQSQVDFEGEGEILEVLAMPSDGHRSVRRDPKSGLVTHESYQSIPSGYVVRRYGFQPKSIVLTFDDGPDPQYTPQILDILKREHVPAAFFVIGNQAEYHPDILGRMWDEGHEIGNHTWSHPNLAQANEQQTRLEITTTQRIIEAVTGRITTLFRPPYAIDVEPTTGDQLRPIMLASKWNFLSVGEKNDPQDWNLIKIGPNGEQVRRTATDIAQSVWDNRNEGNVILLHDGGGDRTATLQALPMIIHRLKEAGYKFINVSDLLPPRPGLNMRDVVMPRVTGREEVLVGVDKWVFEATYLIQRLLVTLFTLSIVLGITRQLFVAVAALLQRRKEQERERQLAGLQATGVRLPSVSVVIAAYNEEKVIRRTIGAVLESHYPNIEVIVVDDGSHDGTFNAAQEGFSHDPRVKALSKVNGGKATALNFGLKEARGDVIVALDADTLFTPDTVALLARHFLDPEIGAVSGNVRVGNIHNLVTRWQALEYVTSQNFDRRAYDLLNCITVVPGAVGAWRRTALDEVGGYTSDTLAEDADLTWKIRQAGWRIENDSRALAYTEAPETIRTLARQRFRWAFGTLQNLWKHRTALFRYGWFGWAALPSLWLYQILFPAISPAMDIVVIWALYSGHMVSVLWYFLMMIGVEFLGASLAIAMDKGNPRLLPWLFIQRLVYRQVMYYVILKSVVMALRGGAVGWDKFERKGTAQIEVRPVKKGRLKAFARRAMRRLGVRSS